MRGVLLAAAVVCAGIAAYAFGVWARPAPEIAGTALEQAPDIRDVELVGASGETVSLADFDGAMQLLFFGYTRCPDVCPLTLAKLATTYRSLDEPSDLRVVMVTVDPEHDTPEVVQRYAAGFHPDFVGFSGSQQQIATAAKRFYIGVAESAPGQIQHTDMVVVVDGDGRFRWVYSQADLQHLGRDVPELRRRL